MPAFAFYDPAPSFRDVLAENVIGGGSLTFYERGTTTPKNTWSDPELTVLNTNPIVLDSAGRPNVGIFGDGEYSVKCMDVAGNTIWTRVIIPGGDTAVALPTLLADQFYTSDGSNILATYIIQVPDPTGELDKVLKSDNVNAYWATETAVPDLPADGIEVITTTGIRVGNRLIQWGTETMPITGTHTTTKAVVFPTAFNAAPYFVVVSNTTGGITPNGAQGTITPQGQSSTGFTINHDVNINSSDAGWNISIAAVNQWVAIGPVTP